MKELRRWRDGDGPDLAFRRPVGDVCHWRQPTVVAPRHGYGDRLSTGSRYFHLLVLAH
jgi:hypothetical protein